MPQGNPLRQKQRQDRTPPERTLPGIPLKPTLWQDLKPIIKFFVVYIAFIIFSSVASSTGSISPSNKSTAPFPNIFVNFFVFSGAVIMNYVVDISMSNSRIIDIATSWYID